MTRSEWKTHWRNLRFVARDPQNMVNVLLACIRIAGVQLPDGTWERACEAEINWENEYRREKRRKSQCSSK